MQLIKAAATNNHKCLDPPYFPVIISKEEMLFGAPLSEHKLEGALAERTRNAPQEVYHGSHLRLCQFGKHQH